MKEKNGKKALESIGHHIGKSREEGRDHGQCPNLVTWLSKWVVGKGGVLSPMPLGGCVIRFCRLCSLKRLTGLAVPDECSFVLPSDRVRVMV